MNEIPIGRFYQILSQFKDRAHTLHTVKGAGTVWRLFMDELKSEIGFPLIHPDPHFLMDLMEYIMRCFKSNKVTDHPDVIEFWEKGLFDQIDILKEDHSCYTSIYRATNDMCTVFDDNRNDYSDHEYTCRRLKEEGFWLTFVNLKGEQDV